MTLDNASETPPEPMQQPVAAEAWKGAAGQVSAGPFRCLSETAENRTFLQGATRKTHLPTEGRQTFQQRGGGTTPQGAPRKGCRGLDVPSRRTHSGSLSDLGGPGDIRTWSSHECSAQSVARWRAARAPQERVPSPATALATRPWGNQQPALQHVARARLGSRLDGAVPQEAETPQTGAPEGQAAQPN